MGIMGAVGAGLAEAGGAAAEIGFAKVKSAIEEDRTARLAELQSEIRMRDDQTTRDRNKTDAAEGRSRVAAYSAPSVTQANADTAESAGLMSADSVGADENVGVDVQRRERAPTLRESADRARAAGDLPSMGLMGTEADRVENNARAEKTRLTADANTVADNARADKEFELRKKAADRILSKEGTSTKEKEAVREAIRYAMHYRSVLETKPGDADARARYNEAMTELAALTGKMPEQETETVKQTTKTTDPMTGTETSEERNVKRKVGAPSGPQPGNATTKVVNGVTWTKVPGGWKKATP